MKREISLYIDDILDCINQIEEYTKSPLDYIGFKENRLIQDAVIRRIEIMGEAIKQIPEDFKAKYNEIEWKKIAGIRDILIHQYFGVNVDRIWVVSKIDIPNLKEKVIKIKKDLEEKI